MLSEEPTTEFVTFRATASQKEAILRAAHAERRSVSQWCRLKIEPALDVHATERPEVPRGHRG